MHNAETGKGVSAKTARALAEVLKVPVEELAPAPKPALPRTIEEALEQAGAPTSYLALPLDEFRELYRGLTKEEARALNGEIVREREMLRPVIDRWKEMPPSKERSQLYQLWEPVLMRMLTAAAETEALGDRETAWELQAVGR